MDDPLVVSNMLNITFGYFIFRQPFPSMIELGTDKAVGWIFLRHLHEILNVLE
jgi:hypothetical protein